MCVKMDVYEKQGCGETCWRVCGGGCLCAGECVVVYVCRRNWMPCFALVYMHLCVSYKEPMYTLETHTLYTHTLYAQTHPTDTRPYTHTLYTGNLFFKDYTRVATDVRIKNWDREFAQLKSLPNVVITPHVAFMTDVALREIREVCAVCCCLIIYVCC